MSKEIFIKVSKDKLEGIIDDLGIEIDNYSFGNHREKLIEFKETIKSILSEGIPIEDDSLKTDEEILMRKFPGPNNNGLDEISDDEVASQLHEMFSITDAKEWKRKYEELKASLPPNPSKQL